MLITEWFSQYYVNFKTFNIKVMYLMNMFRLERVGVWATLLVVITLKTNITPVGVLVTESKCQMHIKCYCYVSMQNISLDFKLTFNSLMWEK